MINKTLLKSNMGIFNNINVEKQQIENLSLYRNELNNYVELHNNLFFPNDTIMIDASDFLKIYLKNIIDFNFDSVLFVGLGLGAFAYLSQDETSIIDVIEINPNIITMCNNVGHLKSNVNIINEDIFIHNTNKKYDLIVFDIWNEKNENFMQQVQILSDLFANNINTNGKIEFPLLNYALN